MLWQFVQEFVARTLQLVQVLFTSPALVDH